MRKSGRQIGDAMVKYWSNANEKVVQVLLGYALFFLEGCQNQRPLESG